jgi:hypothetical protein
MDAVSADRSPPSGAASTLDQFIDRVRPGLSDRKLSTKSRVHLLWSATNAARELAAADVLRETVTAVAVDSRLIDRRGFWVPTDVRDKMRRHGAADIAHVIHWALKKRNPF